MKRTVFFLTALGLVGLTAGGLAAQCCGTKAAGANGNGGAAAPGTVDTWTVATLMRAKAPVVVLDARAEAEERIPGAKVLSPAEATPERLAQVVGARDRLVITYCDGPRCALSVKLAAKLQAAGYRNVLVFREGWAGWRKWKACCAAGKAGASPGCTAGGPAPRCDRAGRKEACPECAAKKAAAGAPVATVDTPVLAALLRARVPLVLIDARAGKYDDGRRLPGARALKCEDCLGKPEALATLAGAKDRLVVTYCGGPKCPLAKKVAAVLRRAGYANVLVYRDGIAGWSRAGFEVAAREPECCGSCEGGGQCRKEGGACPEKSGRAGGCQGGDCGKKKAKGKRL